GVAGGMCVEPLRGLTVVHDAFRDPSLYQRDALLRRALDIEGDREGTVIEAVIPQREAWTCDLLADGVLHEGAAVPQRLAGEPGQGHETQDRRHGELLENRLE